MGRLLCVAYCTAGVFSQCAAGQFVAIDFSGTVTFVYGDPFMAGITVLAPVAGRALYDTQSPATHPNANFDETGYRQQIPNGFTAAIGNTTVRADDYIVYVINDGDGGAIDTISVWYSGQFNPPLQTPLMVNGQPYPHGYFRINFDGPPNSFSNSSLPAQPDLNNFSSIYNFFDPDERDRAFFDVLFQNDTFSARPVIPGDYDTDGDVDEDDYGKWQETFGSSLPGADGNGNGVVDAADYVVWRKYVSPPQMNGEAAPEPRPELLLVISVFTCVRWIGWWRASRGR
jgi:hypothetical protein